MFEDRHLVLTTYFAVVANGALLSRCPVPNGQMRNGRLVAGQRKSSPGKSRCCNRLVSAGGAYEKDGRRTRFMLLSYENGGLHLLKHLVHILVLQYHMQCLVVLAAVMNELPIARTSAESTAINDCRRTIH